MDTNSIVDFLKQSGQPADYASRANLAASHGIQGYAGTAQQNTQLLGILRGGGQTTPTTSPTQQPQQQEQPTNQPSGQSTSQPSGQHSSTQDLVNAGFYGYTGWNDAEALADFKDTGGEGKGGPSSGKTGGGTDTSFINQPTINLPEIYDTLQADSGITELEAKLSAQTQSFNDAQSKINDNPFLSEASRVGRVQKLQLDFNANTQGIRDDIATQKADIETKLNIQMKQFDINSDQASQALDQFQVLLGSGALNNASGEDIANITRATGLSSSMIQSAIQASQKEDVQTSVINWDDGENQGFSIINTQTGEIIKSDTIAQSEPSSPGGGTSTGNIESQFADEAKTIKGQSVDGTWIGEFPLLVAKYAPFMSLQEIYKLYAQSYLGQKYGTPDESAGDIKEIYDFYRKGE